MSFCRFAEDSHVYVYGTADDEICCCACLLMSIDGPDGWNFKTDSAATFLAHLNEHVAAGHLVPERCFERLAVEAQKQT